MKRLYIAFAGVVALSGAAAAADLSRPPPRPVYQAAPVVFPAYNWTGFYVGLNGGGGFGSSNWQAAGSDDISGGLFGGTVGYNYQFGQAVAGVEGDFDWSGIKGTTQNACPFGCQTSDSWISTVRGRLGYAADRYLPFVTGGAAFGNVRAGLPGFAQSSSTQTGWTLGGGLEVSLFANWTAKVEYLYVDLGSFNCGVNCGLGLVTDNVSFHTNILRAGLNYRF